jgi:hypothetical protein
MLSYGPHFIGGERNLSTKEGRLFVWYVLGLGFTCICTVTDQRSQGWKGCSGLHMRSCGLNCHRCFDGPVCTWRIATWLILWALLAFAGMDTYCVGHYSCAVVREARPDVTSIIEKNSEAKIKHATEGYHKIWCWHGVSSRSDWKHVSECYGSRRLC